MMSEFKFRNTVQFGSYRGNIKHFLILNSDLGHWFIRLTEWNMAQYGESAPHLVLPLNRSDDSIPHLAGR